MRMRIVSLVSLVFIGISIVFLAVSLRDVLHNGSRMTIARRVWLRMALIFALVATGLYVVQGYLE